MVWLFERTVEAAAWVAMLVAWCSLGLGLYWMYGFVATLSVDPTTLGPNGEVVVGGPNYELLRDATKAFGAFVGFALALGGLACVDRFLFDADDPDA